MVTLDKFLLITHYLLHSFGVSHFSKNVGICKFKKNGNFCTFSFFLFTYNVNYCNSLSSSIFFRRIGKYINASGDTIYY